MLFNLPYNPINKNKPLTSTFLGGANWGTAPEGWSPGGWLLTGLNLGIEFPERVILIGVSTSGIVSDVIINGVYATTVFSHNHSTNSALRHYWAAVALPVGEGFVGDVEILTSSDGTYVACSLWALDGLSSFSPVETLADETAATSISLNIDVTEGSSIFGLTRATSGAQTWTGGVTQDYSHSRGLFGSASSLSAATPYNVTLTRQAAVAGLVSLIVLR